MSRIYRMAISHRTMLKALFIGLAMASMVLGFGGDAFADEGFDP